METGLMYYQAAAAANVVVSPVKSKLIGILVGTDVGSAVVEVSDSATDGDGNIKIYKAGSTLMTANGGYIPVNAVFENGITADIVNQTYLTFIYKPL